MASIRDGPSILFTRAGAILKGPARESEAWRRTSERGGPWAGIFDGLPEEFAGVLDEPAFLIVEATFCLWRRPSDPTWRAGTIEPLDGDDPDGSAELMRSLDGARESYGARAEGDFEATVSLSGEEHAFAYRGRGEAHQP